MSRQENGEEQKGGVGLSFCFRQKKKKEEVICFGFDKKRIFLLSAKRKKKEISCFLLGVLLIKKKGRVSYAEYLRFFYKFKIYFFVEKKIRDLLVSYLG